MLGEASVISSSTAEPEPPLGEAVELMLRLFAMDGGVVEIRISFSWQVKYEHFPPT